MARGAGAGHDERRQEIVEAVFRIVDGRGLDGVSLRDVAAEAGVSVGRVQHYFPTKDALVWAAFERVNELGGELVRQRVAETTAGAVPSPRVVLREIGAALLPVDDLHRRALRIGIAFSARSMVEPEFAEKLRTGYGELHQLMVLILGQAQEAGLVPQDLDPAHEAHLLLAAFEGLSTHALVGHHTPDSALAVIDTHLDRLFTPPRTDP